MSAPTRDLLRFVTAGSVDDGKSTLVGRMLHDAGALYEDHVAALRKKAGTGPLDFSLVTDGLRAERAQGITIDVAYRYFETPRRRFIIADTPGHEQYTRNMATGASTADVAVILVDASAGILTQGRRHGYIASLLAVPRLVVAVNKMDLVDHAEAMFNRIRDEYAAFARPLGFTEIVFIPVSAINGDNLVAKSARMAWYDGPTVLGYLEETPAGVDAIAADFRFPVQRVVVHAGFRGYSGTIASGSVRPGDEVVVLPSRRRTRIERIVAFAGDMPEASAAQAVTFTLADELDVSRGDLIAHAGRLPHTVRSLDAMLVWMNATPLAVDRILLVKNGARTVKASLASIAFRKDPDTLEDRAATQLEMNDIAGVTLTLFEPLFVDEYRANRATGSFILIDPVGNETLGAGMVVDRLPGQAKAWHEAAHDTPVSHDIREQRSSVAEAERSRLLRQRAVTFWFTGLSGSGKSTLAYALERRLVAAGHACFVLDGDNLRHGLSRDLGFSPDDRRENIRRVAEVARLMNEAGLVVIAAFISPYREDRAMARRVIGEERFREVYLDASLDTCESRDPKGLYARARRGEIVGFTGIGAPYEPPDSPDLRLETGSEPLERSEERLLQAVLEGILPGG